VSEQTLGRRTVRPGVPGAAIAQRHEEIFYSLKTVQEVPECWRIHYNTVATYFVRLSTTRTKAWQTEVRCGVKWKVKDALDFTTSPTAARYMQSSSR
jgi:hypothetical protein